MEVEYETDQESVDKDIITVKAINLWPEGVFIDEIDADFCPTEDHISNRKDITIDEFNKTLEKNDKSFNEVESISLVSLTVGHDLLLKICMCCPKLSCLHISGTRFTSKAVEVLNEKMAANITHFCGNGSIRSNAADEKGYPGAFSQFIRNSKLTDLVLYIGDQDNFTGDEFKGLQKSLRELTMVLLIYQENSEYSVAERQFGCSYVKNIKKQGNSVFAPFTTNPLSSLENALINLYLATGKSLKFLQVKNHYEIMATQRSFVYIPLFENLRALNISLKNELTTNPENSFLYENSRLYYELITQRMSELVSLTVNFEPSLSADTTREFFSIITNNPKFKKSLKRLRLINACLDSDILNSIMVTFLNLRSFQLVSPITNEEDDLDIIEIIRNYTDEVPNLEFILELDLPDIQSPTEERSKISKQS